MDKLTLINQIIAILEQHPKLLIVGIGSVGAFINKVFKSSRVRKTRRRK
jgi:hypothetical protein